MSNFDTSEPEQLESLLECRCKTDEAPAHGTLQWQAHRRWTHRFHIASLYFMNILLLLGVVSMTIRDDLCTDPSLKTYSPANSAVEYEEIVFTDIPGQLSPYFPEPPNDVKDELWDQLYTQTGALLYTPEETKKMPNQTVAISSPEGDRGIYDLEVFHELHCLNTMRKTLFFERYPEWSPYHPNGTRDHEKLLHHAHCIDRLRQGVQCAGNVGANYYYWEEDRNKWRVDMRSTHTCRKLSKLQEWARARDYAGFDPRIKGHRTSN